MGTIVHPPVYEIGTVPLAEGDQKERRRGKDENGGEPESADVGPAPSLVAVDVRTMN